MEFKLICPTQSDVWEHGSQHVSHGLRSVIDRVRQVEVASLLVADGVPVDQLEAASARASAKASSPPPTHRPGRPR